METDKIKKLIDAFYNGETSGEQEQELYHYFLQEEVAEEFSHEKEPILNMLSPIDDAVELPEGFTNRLESLIDALDKKENSKKKIKLWKWAGSVAAGLTILLSVGLYTVSEQNRGHQSLLVDTYNDPEEAYAEAQKALLMVSSKMNKGVDQFEKAEEGIAKVNETLHKKLN